MSHARRRAPFVLASLALIWASAAVHAEGGVVPAEVREFLVGGHTAAGTAPVPPQGALDGGRCELECEFPTRDRPFLVVDVEGPGGPYGFQYDRRGCWWFSTPGDPAQGEPAGQPEGPRNGVGRKVLDVDGCTSLVIRPAAADVVADPWACTQRPAFFRPTEVPVERLVQKPFWPESVTLPLSPPLWPLGADAQPRLDDYEAFGTCLRDECLAARTPHRCLPDPAAQVTGRVRVEW